MKNYNSLEKSHTVLFQVYAVGCTVTRSFPTGFRLKWLLQGSRLTGSFQGWCCSHLCYRLVAAESFLGASSWGREQRASRSHTHALDLADHPCSCCVVYINIYIYIYILLLWQVYICVCALKITYFLQWFQLYHDFFTETTKSCLQLCITQSRGLKLLKVKCALV